MAAKSKQMICPRCQQIMASAVFRLIGGLRITTMDGILLPPVTGHLLVTVAQQRLESASAEDYPEAKRRLDFVVRHSGDRFYDIKCPNGHYTLKTAPQITKAIRRAPDTGVVLD